MKERTFQQIETNGIRLRTVVEGKGPLVILLHGWPQCWYLWRHQIDPIVEAGFQVAVPDQRGLAAVSGRPLLLIITFVRSPLTSQALLLLLVMTRSR